jgi:hypothetical protein
MTEWLIGIIPYAHQEKWSLFAIGINIRVNIYENAGKRVPQA